MRKNNNTNPDNQPNQTPNRRVRQAKTPVDRTDEARYRKLPVEYRPFAGRAQRDPLDYDSHPIRVSLARKRLIFSNLNDNNSIKVLTV